jgi:hypothetical protein
VRTARGTGRRAHIFQGLAGRSIARTPSGRPRRSTSGFGRSPAPTRQGHLEHILLSHDVCIRSHLRASGGTGYTYVPTGFADELRSRGLSDDDIQKLLVENPRRALTGQT